jgi:hypothetical protein
MNEKNAQRALSQSKKNTAANKRLLQTIMLLSPDWLYPGFDITRD